jgi:hypothetical protein
MTTSPASRILRKLPRENAFYFFTSIGNYTGEKAASLKEFVERVREVNVKSLEFHLYRGDFERWTNQTLEDGDLAERIRSLKSLSPLGDSLRDQLFLIVSKQYKKLKGKSSAKPE